MKNKAQKLKELFMEQYMFYKEWKIGYVQMKNWLKDQPDYWAWAILILKKELEQLSLGDKNK